MGTRYPRVARRSGGTLRTRRTGCRQGDLRPAIAYARPERLYRARIRNLIGTRGRAFNRAPRLCDAPPQTGRAGHVGDRSGQGGAHFGTAFGAATAALTRYPMPMEGSAAGAAPLQPSWTAPADALTIASHIGVRSFIPPSVLRVRPNTPAAPAPPAVGVSSDSLSPHAATFLLVFVEANTLSSVSVVPKRPGIANSPPFCTILGSTRARVNSLPLRLGSCGRSGSQRMPRCTIRRNTKAVYVDTAS